MTARGKNSHAARFTRKEAHHSSTPRSSTWGSSMKLTSRSRLWRARSFAQRRMQAKSLKTSHPALTRVSKKIRFSSWPTIMMSSESRSSSETLLSSRTLFCSAPKKKNYTRQALHVTTAELSENNQSEPCQRRFLSQMKINAESRLQVCLRAKTVS